MIKHVAKESSVGDACPICGATLGLPPRYTRRQVVLTATRGTFVWRCPDCSGMWSVRSPSTATAAAS